MSNHGDTLTIEPSQADFAAGIAKGEAQLVWTKLIADLDTPVSAMLKLMGENEPSFLLESVHGGETRGRYSMIGLKPDLVFRFKGNKAEISSNGSFDDNAFKPCSEAPLDALRSLQAANRIEIPETLPPMAGGMFGYMTYDIIRLHENIPDSNPDTIGVPDGMFMRPSVTAIFDNISGEIYIVAPIWKERAENGDASALYDAAVKLLHETVDKLQGAPAGKHYYRLHDTPKLEPKSNLTREEYHAMVEKAKEYIVAGDIFQVVPSQRFEVPFKLPAFSLYRALRQLNPSPFLVYLNFGAFALVASSPEILVRLRDNTVTIRPIAGTRKRGKNKAEDAALAKDLMSDPKELAEHLMLLDLGRNDVGRVAKTGTVTVTEQMIVEHYSHVMHIVSNVEGKIDPQFDAIDALLGGFPAGTVSGAPKIRAMEIIDELENVKRSFYGGCMGYFAANGTMDTCISLRTGLVKDGKLYIQAGGGVVADSDPEAEYQESRNKAMALIRAAEEAAHYQ